MIKEGVHSRPELKRWLFFYSSLCPCSSGVFLRPFFNTSPWRSSILLYLCPWIDGEIPSHLSQTSSSTVDGNVQWCRLMSLSCHNNTVSFPTFDSSGGFIARISHWECELRFHTPFLLLSIYLPSPTHLSSPSYLSLRSVQPHVPSPNISSSLFSATLIFPCKHKTKTDHWV